MKLDKSSLKPLWALPEQRQALRRGIERLSGTIHPVANYTFTDASENTLRLSSWHVGEHYDNYLYGTPESVVTRTDTTNGEREKVLLEARRLNGEIADVAALAYQRTTTPIDPSTARNTHEFEFLGLINSR